MSIPSEQSPFAEFAEPKRSAVEEWREQQRHARAMRRQMVRTIVWVLSSLLIGSATGAAIGLSLSFGRFVGLPYTMLGAVVGGLLGLGAGVLIACGCVAAMIISVVRWKAGSGADWPFRDIATALKVQILAWTPIAMLFGSTWGGLEALAWSGHPQPYRSAFPWAIVGAILGSAVVGLAWTAWGRTKKGA